MRLSALPLAFLLAAPAAGPIRGIPPGCCGYVDCVEADVEIVEPGVAIVNGVEMRVDPSKTLRSRTAEQSWFCSYIEPESGCAKGVIEQKCARCIVERASWGENQVDVFQVAGASPARKLLLEYWTPCGSCHSENP